jgi:hypothetical protein
LPTPKHFSVMVKNIIDMYTCNKEKLVHFGFSQWDFKRLSVEYDTVA